MEKKYHLNFNIKYYVDVWTEEHLEEPIQCDFKMLFFISNLLIKQKARFDFVCYFLNLFL